MKIALIIAAALGLSACNGLASITSGGNGATVLGNLQECTRHYEGAIGAGVNGSFRIDCPPKAPAIPVPPQ